MRRVSVDWRAFFSVAEQQDQQCDLRWILLDFGLPLPSLAPPLLATAPADACFGGMMDWI